jgi:choline dehydrogenase-like flavoprotein
MDSSELEKIMADFHNGEGILKLITEAQQAFIVSSKAEAGWPDIWISMDPNIRIDDQELEIHFFDILGRPQSKGTLTLDTDKYKAGIKDDVELALIDYQFLSHPDDMEVLLDGVKVIFQIIETEALRSINITYTEGPDPACSAFSYLTDDYWRCKIQQNTVAWIHMVGTCSLGPDSGDSTTSVVDTKFRVRGVSNLRVVDASVIPEVTNANLNVPIMMLAEKAADDITTLYLDLDTTTTTPAPSTTTTISNDATTTQSNETSSILMERNKLFLILAFILIFKFFF